MKNLLLATTLLVVGASPAIAQVGIGTNTPSGNAVLDVTSATKGLMLPRLNDTTTVRNPSAGLMIYSRQTQAPAYHNGIRWNTLAARTTSGTSGRQDSVSYTVTGASAPYTNGVFSTVSAISSGNSHPYTPSNGGGGSGRVTFDNVIIKKAADANSIGFVRTVSTGALNASSMTMEFKVFAAGSSTPYYSIKISGPQIIAYNVSVSNNLLVEQVTISANIYGYKNWVTGQSFAWDIIRNISVPY